MTAITGFTTSWEDPNTGATYPVAWIQIRLINYIADISCQVVTDVYLNQTKYIQKSRPVAENIVPQVLGTIQSEIWNTYFAVSVMQQANHDINTQSLTYLQSIL